jgi:hypothetical protein
LHEETLRLSREERQRWYAIWSKYGLTKRQVEQMIVDQEGKCLICDADLALGYHIDHNHKTGVVRGILCGPCNRGLGCFRDDPDLLAAAVAYLK